LPKEQGARQSDRRREREDLPGTAVAGAPDLLRAWEFAEKGLRFSQCTESWKKLPATVTSVSVLVAVFYGD